MAIQLSPEEKDVHRVVQAVRELVEGRHNAASRFTLTPGATSTVVAHPNCSRDCEPQFSPRTANAAAAVPTTWVSDVSQGSFTVTHLSNGQTDREFGFTVTGG
jgi:hypothetical protein